MKRTHFSVSSLSAAVVLCAFAGTALAAPMDRIDTASQQIQRTDLKKQLLEQPAADAVPSLYKEESEDVGPQRVLKQGKPPKQWFEASMDVQYGYTSNMNLTNDATTETSLMISTAQIAVAPEPFEVAGGQLTLKSGYRHQKFNYGLWSSNQRNLNDADFDVSSIFAQGRFQLNDNWGITGGLDYNRLLSAATGRYDEFYSELVPNVTLERRFKVDEKSMLSLSLGGNYHATHVDPPQGDANDRIDEVLMASYMRELVPNVVVQPFYRMQFTQYLRNPNHSRKDMIQTAGLAVSYSVNKWASVRTYVNFEQRDTSGPTAVDYRKLDTGLGVSLQARF